MSAPMSKFVGKTTLNFPVRHKILPEKMIRTQKNDSAAKRRYPEARHVSAG
jgi:hypothetical protein